jgi:hypothetical protein
VLSRLLLLLLWLLKLRWLMLLRPARSWSRVAIYTRPLWVLLLLLLLAAGVWPLAGRGWSLWGHQLHSCL